MLFRSLAMAESVVAGIGVDARADFCVVSFEHPAMIAVIANNAQLLTIHDVIKPSRDLHAISIIPDT